MTIAALPRNWHSKIRVTDTGCWHWTAAVNSQGYGCVGVLGKIHSTHRISYELLVGPIPAGLQIDHLCRNKRCCNPEHLEPVTAKENNRRARLARLPDCPKGHGFKVGHCQPCDDAKAPAVARVLAAWRSAAPA